MGDAGSLVPALGEEDQDGSGQSHQREVVVLVTGFGPFKTFAQNPSNLIAQHLPSVLYLDHLDPSPSLPGNTSSSLKINLQIYPHPLRVSYPTIAQAIPRLLHPTHSPSHPHDRPRPGIEPDYVLHLGMADGRKYYSLETLAHRDGYTILDIDGVDGMKCGSRCWTEQGCPSVLEAKWDHMDVLRRWKEGAMLQQQQQQQQQELERKLIPSTISSGQGRRRGEEPAAAAAAAAAVTDLRLSSDPGRFLCDFIFYASLSERWMEDQQRQQQRQQEKTHDQTDQQPLLPINPSTPREPDTNESIGSTNTNTGTIVDIGTENNNNNNNDSQEGKVAFLHVPGDTDVRAIERGVLITEAAIRALVGSWECGGGGGGF